MAWVGVEVRAITLQQRIHGSLVLNYRLLSPLIHLYHFLHLLLIFLGLRYQSCYDEHNECVKIIIIITAVTISLYPV